MPGPDTRAPFAALGGVVPAEFAALPTPCYLLDEGALARNGKMLGELAARTGCKVLLAQKAFSNYDLYPVLAPCLAGTEASGLFEARLGAEEMPGKEVHVFCAAYREDEMAELLRWADHIVFNSPAQLAKFGPMAKAAGKSVGLRVNPECSTQEGHAIYDPCAPGSRLGTTRAQWDAAVAQNPALPDLLDGLHFHTLCEQDSDALAVTLDAVAEKFGDLLPRMKWLNMASPLTGVQPGEAFDVLPWAEAASNYLLSICRDIHMPRKLKVAFCNGVDDCVHATFRDMGFIAQPTAPSGCISPAAWATTTAWACWPWRACPPPMCSTPSGG